MTTTTDRPDLQDLARDVARELTALDSEAWEYVGEDADNYNHVGRVRRVNDHAAMLWIHGYGWTRDATKVEIHGDYPRAADGQYVYTNHEDRTTKRPEIRVSWARGADTIAREIIRRMLPAYLERLNAVKEVVRVRDEYADNTRALAERFAAAIGSTVTGEDRIYQRNGPTWEVSGDRLRTVHTESWTEQEALTIARMVAARPSNQR